MSSNAAKETDKGMYVYVQICVCEWRLFHVENSRISVLAITRLVGAELSTLFTSASMKPLR